MAYPDSGRGWVPSSDERFPQKTEALSFDTQTILDGDISDLQSDYPNLVSLVFDGCTFVGDSGFGSLPTTATMTTLTAKGSTGLVPGEGDGVPSTWSTAVNIAAIDVSNNGWTQAQVNAFLVALDTAVQAGLGGSAAACTLDISSNAVPSGAGATAVTALQGYSPAWTITADS